MNWSPAIQGLIEEFQEIESKFEKLETLMDFADELVPLPVEDWNESNLVRGCQSIAHIEVELANDEVILKSAADARMVEGLQGILTIAVNGNTPDKVLELTPDFAEEMGLLNTLTPSRSNGFRTMFDMIQNRVKELK
ncbi:MAG: SufE family protein [Candidatus Poseidoniaceae archaeon]|jgi:cysteine desulfuration protein SufE|nr:SufE family protein [Candidatus Poseidoniaceae archaeon]